MKLSDVVCQYFNSPTINSSRSEFVYSKAHSPRRSSKQWGNVGYDEAAFQEGDSLLEAYREDVRIRQNEFGEQISATEALNDAWDAFHGQTYIPHVTIARLVFDSDGTLSRLGIDGRRPEGFDEYVREARRFYSAIEAYPEIQEALAVRGITEQAVTDARADLEALEDLDHEQEREISEAQQATRRRNDTRRAFADWLSTYQQFAKIAMADQPDLLEQLGIVVRSE